MKPNGYDIATVTLAAIIALAVWIIAALLP